MRAGGPWDGGTHLSPAAGMHGRLPSSSLIDALLDLQGTTFGKVLIPLRSYH